MRTTCGAVRIERGAAILFPNRRSRWTVRNAVADELLLDADHRLLAQELAVLTQRDQGVGRRRFREDLYVRPP